MVVGYRDERDKIAVFDPRTLTLLGAYKIEVITDNNHPTWARLRGLRIVGDTIYILVRNSNDIYTREGILTDFAVIPIDISGNFISSKSAAFKSNHDLFSWNKCDYGGSIGYNEENGDIILYCEDDDNTFIATFRPGASSSAEVFDYNKCPCIFFLAESAEMDNIGNYLLLRGRNRRYIISLNTGRVSRLIGPRPLDAPIKVSDAIFLNDYLYLYAVVRQGSSYQFQIAKMHPDGTVDGCSTDQFFDSNDDIGFLGSEPSQTGTAPIYHPLVKITPIQPNITYNVPLEYDEDQYDMIPEDYVCPQQ